MLWVGVGSSESRKLWKDESQTETLGSSLAFVIEYAEI